MNPLMSLLSKALAPLQRRVRLMVARGIIELVDDSKKLQTAQVTIQDDVVRDDVERFQQYGFSSVPKADAEAIVLMVGGNADHPVVINVDDRRYRPRNLAEGESCMYTLGNGVRVLCKANGTIEIGTSPTDFVALASKVNAELTKISTTLSSLTGGITTVASFGTPYSKASVAASEVKAK
jgi:phage baseplate assembly protein V